MHDGSTVVSAAKRIEFASNTGQNRLAIFVTEQRWQGYITAVEENIFSAIIYDVSSNETDEIEEVVLIAKKSRC